jgi:CarboxypepD_reg-like domain
MFSFTFCWSQIRITGTINDQGGIPLPGATVSEKGTDNSTETDLNGHFTIYVKDSSSILTFSYVGYLEKEILLNGQNEMTVTLKEFVIHEAWDQKIGFCLNSGLINNPFGGQFDFSIPVFREAVGLKSRVSYQTNLKENRFFSAGIGLHHIRLNNRGFGVNIDTYFRNILSDNGYDLEAYSIETTWPIYRFHLILGCGQIDSKRTDKSDSDSGLGLITGIQTWIFNPINLSISVKVSIYKDLREYQAEINRRFGRINTFVRYYNLNSFSELSMGIGIELTYYFKNQRN